METSEGTATWVSRPFEVFQSWEWPCHMCAVPYKSPHGHPPQHCTCPAIQNLKVTRRAARPSRSSSTSHKGVRAQHGACAQLFRWALPRYCCLPRAVWPLRQPALRDFPRSSHVPTSGRPPSEYMQHGPRMGPQEASASIGISTALLRWRSRRASAAPLSSAPRPLASAASPRTAGPGPRPR